MAVGDQLRVVQLLRAGLDRQEIAALLKVTPAQLHDAITDPDAPALPGGSGGGGDALSLGPWVEVDYTTPDFPFGLSELEIGTFDAPCEVEMVYTPQINTNGGFWIADEDNVGYDSLFGNYGETSVTEKIRGIVPAGKTIRVAMLGSVQETSMGNLRYRLLNGGGDGGGGAGGGTPNYTDFNLSGSLPNSGAITPQDSDVDNIVRFTFGYTVPDGVDNNIMVGLRAMIPEGGVDSEIDYVSFQSGSGEASVKALIPAGWKYVVNTNVNGDGQVFPGDIIEYPYNYGA